jgi:hypothetical protein
MGFWSVMFVRSRQENVRPILRRSPAVSPYVGRQEIAPCGECVKIAPERTSMATTSQDCNAIVFLAGAAGTQGSLKRPLALLEGQ